MNYINKQEEKLKRELSSVQWNEAKRMVDYFKSIKVAIPFGLIKTEVENKFKNSN